VRIDHGFVTPHFEVTSARIDSDVTLSDHYPLLFTLRWSKQQP
ncbi:MAG: AP endonuclease, partial [Bacteroidaceae bacterium]|nr:AP endonuclease [Bacteroidaceae bacterium]